MVLIITNQFSDQYELGDDLGKGTYSIVKKCKHKITKYEYAAKIINTKNLSERDWRKLETEARICQKLNHPNTIHLFESITEENYHYFVFDLVLGGELFDEIVVKEYFSELDASRCLKQVLEGVEYCHKNSIVHRDLKPENLLLVSKDPNSLLKIADFGLAIEVDGNEPDLYGFAGTPIYLSPEVIKNDPYGKPVDIWACGVILYILLVGDLPFWNTDKNDLFFLIKTGALNDTSKEWKSISSDAKDLILKLLTIDPERRLTASEALKHPWIQNCEYYAPAEHRVQTVSSLKIFNARRKLKGAIFTTLVAKKFLNNLSK